MAALHGLLAPSFGGTLGVIFLEGEPGISKSTLLSQVVDVARRESAQVYSGRAEGPGIGPFAPFLQSLASNPDSNDRHRELLELVSGPTKVDTGLQFRIVDALVERLEAASLRGPVLLALDDMHWADTSTLVTLRAVVQRLEFLPLAIVATCRLWPRTPELAELIDFVTRRGAQVVRLSPLGEEDVDQIVQDLMNKSPGPILREQLRRAGGNPMFVGEIIRTLRDEQAVSTAGDVVEAPDIAMPESLARVLLRRLSYLSDDSFRVLEMASVLGAVFSASELAAVMDVSAPQVIKSLEEPLTAGLLEDDAAGLRFRHDVIREAIYENMSPSVRALLHRDVARRLLAEGASAARVARHLMEGAEGDDGDIALLRVAAREIFPSNPAAAIDILRRTLLISKGSRQTDEIRADLVDYLAYSENAVEAEKMARETLGTLRTRELQPRLRSALVHALFTQGRWVDVITEVELAKTVPEMDDVTRGRLVAEAVLAQVWNGDLDRAEEDAEEAMRLGTQTQDAVTLSTALAHSTVVAGGRGQLLEGARLAQRAVDIATAASSSDAQRRHPQMALGMALVAADRLQQGYQALAEGRRISEQTGTLWALPLYDSMLALPLFYLGAWDDAIAEAEAAVAAAEEIGVGAGLVTAFSLLASIAIQRGDESIAEQHLSAADEIIASKGPQWGMWMYFVHARAAATEAREGATIALEYLREVWDSGPTHIEQTLRTGPHLARLAAACEDRALLESITQSVEEAAAIATVPYGNAAARICRGLLEADADLLQAAAAELDASGRKPEAASAWADAGVAFARALPGEEARSAFEAALERYEDLGATRQIARVSADMRAVGLRRGSRGVRDRPTTGWDALTPTELEVVGLTAKGLTNPQIADRLFISRQTVKTHLSHVFAKLNISSRVQLTSEALGRGL